jgi:hypothetical protein
MAVDSVALPPSFSLCLPAEVRAMKQWSSAALPLSILLVLAALTFWLRYVTDFTEKPGDGKQSPRS